MPPSRPRVSFLRSRIDAEALPPLPLEPLALDAWLAALHDPGVDLELVVERPSYWEFSGAWAVDWRELSFHLLYLVVQGDGCMWLDDGRGRDIGPGTMFWLPPLCRHRIEQRDGRNYFIRFRLVRDGRNLTFPGIRLESEGLHLLPLFQQASDDLRFGHPWLPERLRGLLALLATDRREGESQEAAGCLGPAQRRRLAQLVEERWRVSMSPRDLAQAVGLSPVAFARAFRRSFDCTPRRWLADQRLHRVAELLLRDARPVEDLAAVAGFANPSQFSRRFRALFGVSPAEWRRRRSL